MEQDEQTYARHQSEVLTSRLRSHMSELESQITWLEVSVGKLKEVVNVGRTVSGLGELQGTALRTDQLCALIDQDREDISNFERVLGLLDGYPHDGRTI